MPATNIRLAVPDSPYDIEALCGFAKANAIENDELHLFDAAYARRHAVSKLIGGPCFMAVEDTSPIGVMTSNMVDMAYRQADALEITHTYVLPHRRRYPVIAALFDAVEAYADMRRLAVCFHELNWRAAIANVPSDGKRVEKLYKFRKYQGPIGASYMRQPPAGETPPPYRHVGRTYLYPGPGQRNGPASADIHETSPASTGGE